MKPSQSAQPIAERLPAGEESEVAPAFYAPAATAVHLAGVGDGVGTDDPPARQSVANSQGVFNSALTVGLDDKTDRL